MALTPQQVALNARNPAVWVDRIQKAVASMSLSNESRARAILKQFSLSLDNPAKMALSPRDILIAAYEHLIAELLDQTADQFNSTATKIEFLGDVGDAFTPPGSAVTFDIDIAVTNDTGDVITFSPAPEVTIDITGGTATGKAVNGSAGPAVIVELVDGQATITVTVTSTGTVLLGMTDSGSTGLDVSEAVTVTFS